MGTVYTNKDIPSEKERQVWNEYQIYYKEIKDYLDKLSAMANVEDFKNELESIDDKARSFVDYFTRKVDTKEVKVCINNLVDLKKRLETKYADRYHMYSLQENINKNLEKKELGILEVIQDSNELLGLMVKCNSINNMDKDLEKLYDSCAGTIYTSLLNEQIYDKTDIIKELNKDKKYDAVKESLVRYFAEDLSALGSNSSVNQELSNINSGLGYDFISEKAVDEIVEAKFKKEKEEFYDRKEELIKSLKKRVFDYQADAKTLKSNLKESRSDLRGYRVTKVFNTAKLLTFAVIPVVLIGGGYQLGVHLSNKIDEYKTTTRVVNPVTNEVVETLSEVYDERETTYTSTLKVYEPWKKNAKGTGYIRKVTAYVTDPENASTDISKLTEKYHYTEAKEQLEENDNTEESVTLLTETVQDKNDSRKSRKYVVWLTIAGVVLGVGADVLLAYGMEPDEIWDELSDTNSDIRSEKKQKRRLKADKKELKKNITSLGKEIEMDNCIYQFSKEDELSLNVIKKTL